MEQLPFIAKASVEAFLKQGKIPAFKIESKKLKEKKGVFITIKKKGRLRGCIGCLKSDKPLYQLVPQMALAAAFEDPRFKPVSLEELADLEYEVSLIGSLKKISSWREIQLGRHGVLAEAGGRGGLFLPQVALEQGWDLETFLSQLMLKAGLSEDYWKKEAVDFQVFEVETFKV